jgi:hypothetical protein
MIMAVTSEMGRMMPGVDLGRGASEATLVCGNVLGNGRNVREAQNTQEVEV